MSRRAGPGRRGAPLAAPVSAPIWIALAWLALVAPAAGEIYRWTDTQGRVQLSDRPPAEGRAEQVKLAPINSFEGVRIDGPGTAETGPAGAGPVPKVVMFSADWCPVCRRARAFLAERHIPYTDRNIETDPAARKEYERQGGRGVPLILVGERRLSGFSPDSFLSLYER
jgi:glutaredoxin